MYKKLNIKNIKSFVKRNFFVLYSLVINDTNYFRFKNIYLSKYGKLNLKSRAHYA